ncbi:hypothetical protein [Teredinibacter waterburyi]|uniref:hypothetical protein n=1 Tax=Teredinibacter waterburyi TaxID=1500538 RepID=UPI00165EF212|nr:hypothetical protein [Teredinibacter waterburyi]
MSIEFEFEVNWGRNFSSSMIWQKVCQVLDIIGHGFVEEFEGVRRSYDEIFELLEAHDADFFYRTDDLSISLISFSDEKVDRLLIAPPQKSRDTLMEQFALIGSGGFCRWGRVYDSEYNKIQNKKDLRELQVLGVDVTSWAIKSNGLPPPLRKDVIDVASNPGRNIIVKGDIEAVGSTMWLSNEWCADHDVLPNNLNCISLSVFDGGILVTFYDSCFDSWTGDQRSVQERVWKELYGQ